ncbi:MAG: glycine cleavage system protein T [Rhodobacterales bacterium]|nr:MAG: glycine cleavage system protein T [Rhodobacterales bacterium]
MTELRRTDLFDLHIALGAKLVPFAGWEMPVQYPSGVMQEHLHTRAAAGLFDVSHMGQVLLHGSDAAARLEALVPADIVGLAPGRQRYALFTNETGGILDDLMVANQGDRLFLVVNAANAAADIAHLEAHLGEAVEVAGTRALLALQGPAAEVALGRIVPAVTEMRFMDVTRQDSRFGALWISRSGYTGEDGFEISVEGREARALAEALLAMEEVAPIGLGARDSLRLEAGLPLHGSDITPETTPLEAGLGWSIGKARREGPRAGGFPGADAILRQRQIGATAKLAGLRPEGRAPMRAGTRLFERETGGAPLGDVTSGGFGPSIGGPIAMGYLPARLTRPGTKVWGEVRGKRLPARVTPLPFHPRSYKR